MEKPKERLTGLDADGYIISTEEATIIAARPVSEEEKKSIRMHILENCMNTKIWMKNFAIGRLT